MIEDPEDRFGKHFRCMERYVLVGAVAGGVVTIGTILFIAWILIKVL